MTVEYKNWSPQGHRHLSWWQIHADNLQFQGHLDLTYQETVALLYGQLTTHITLRNTTFSIH